MAVDCEIADGIALVTMNRPEALNAFNSEQLRAMLSIFGELKALPDLRCVILTGVGERAFAAGADIKEMVDLTASAGLSFTRLGHAVGRSIENLTVPVIAAINGFALGGGCEIALACDMRIASENAVFAQPEVGLGIPPGWGGTQRLPRLIGPGLAAELIFTGRRVKADEALRIGLVNAVYPQVELLPRCKELAAQIAKNGPGSVAKAKQLMYMAFEGRQSLGLDTEATFFAECFETDEQREGMRAFIEKREPVFVAKAE